MTSQEWKEIAKWYDSAADWYKNSPGKGAVVNIAISSYFSNKGNDASYLGDRAAERDALLSALKNLVDLAEAQFATAPDLWEVNEAKAAIAKAEGNHDDAKRIRMAERRRNGHP